LHDYVVHDDDDDDPRLLDANGKRARVNAMRLRVE
jgi:hypothetical protein